MFSNSDVASKLLAIRHLLELRGDASYRYGAYERAAATVEHAPPLAEMIEKQSLQTLPGIGDSLASTIEALARTGTAPVLDELLTVFPETLLGLLDLDGMGVKTVKRLYDEYGISSPAQLDAALRDGRLRGAPRIGEKTLQIWRRGLLRTRRKKTLLGAALDVATAAMEYLRSSSIAIEHLVYAGSLRRAEPLVGDIDLICTTAHAEAVMAHFTAWNRACDIVSEGPTKASVWLEDGLQIDLRILPDDRFGDLLQHFTGSREHNILLREYALRRGLSISENGITELANGIAHTFRREEELYAFLGMSTIPPELRVGGDEIERAIAGTIPALLEMNDILGDFHMHSTWSDGDDSLEAMIRACAERGYAYHAISDHSPGRGPSYGVTANRLRERNVQIRELGQRYGITTLCASEVDIRADGSLDYDDALLAELDFVVASVHDAFSQTSDEMTARLIKACENPYVNVIGHPTGRMLDGFAGYVFDYETVFSAAARTGTALEIDGQMQRLDLPSNLARQAQKLGCMLTTDSDAHRSSDLPAIELAVSQARRAGLRREDILNTRSLEEVRSFVAHKRGTTR
ncbi:MAG: DNA polymerase/3'-5' exonuclease PolX [Vulcanimicrobiaceae bacterium]